VKVWLESLSVKNAVITVLLVVVVVEAIVFALFAHHVEARIQDQKFYFVPPYIAGTLTIPIKYRRERIMTAISGYVVDRAQNVSASTYDSFYLPILMLSSPEAFPTLKHYFGNLAAFAKKRNIHIYTQIDPATERFEIKGKTGTYKAIGITTIYSNLTEKLIASEVREYVVEWKIDGNYAAITKFDYKVLDSTLPENKPKIPILPR